MAPDNKLLVVILTFSAVTVVPPPIESFDSFVRIAPTGILESVSFTFPKVPLPAVIDPSPRSIELVVSFPMFILSKMPDVPLNLDIVAESTLS